MCREQSNGAQGLQQRSSEVKEQTHGGSWLNIAPIRCDHEDLRRVTVGSEKGNLFHCWNRVDHMSSHNRDVTASKSGRPLKDHFKVFLVQLV